MTTIILTTRIPINTFYKKVVGLNNLNFNFNELFKHVIEMLSVENEIEKSIAMLVEYYKSISDPTDGVILSQAIPLLAKDLYSVLKHNGLYNYGILYYAYVGNVCGDIVLTELNNVVNFNGTDISRQLWK